MTDRKSGIALAHQRRSAKWMRSREWSFKHDTLRRRLYDLASDHHPWWDWGHRLMILTGSDHGGNWSGPSPPTWWYRRSGAATMWRTNFPIHRPRHFQVVTIYDEFRSLTDGLNEDQMYEWQAIGVNGDHELYLGHRYWGGAFYGLRSDEAWLLRRYLRMWRRHDWYGLRSWLYKQGLHAAVHSRKPGSCQSAPPKGQGGYSHWHCRLPRGHGGDHRYNNYTWAEVGGEPIGVFYAPTEGDRATDESERTD